MANIDWFYCTHYYYYYIELGAQIFAVKCALWNVVCNVPFLNDSAEAKATTLLMCCCFCVVSLHCTIHVCMTD